MTYFLHTWVDDFEGTFGDLGTYQHYLDALAAATEFDRAHPGSQAGWVLIQGEEISARNRSAL